MVNLRERNEAFEKAWDELQPRLAEPEFDVDAYLNEKRKELSEETIEQLYIAMKVGKFLALNKEYEQWVRDEEENNLKKSSRVRMFTRRIGYLVAAALIIFFVLVPFLSRHPSYNLTSVIDVLTLVQTVYAEGIEYKLDVGTGPFDFYRKLNELGNFKYGDVDNDKTVDFVLAQDGTVVCFDLYGNTKWDFKLTPELIGDEYKPVLIKEAEHILNDMDNFDSLPKTHPYEFWRTLHDSYHKGEPVTLPAAWDLLVKDFYITEICDFNMDGSNEVLIQFYGLLFVLDSNGKPNKFINDGVERYYMKIFDGLGHDVLHIDDINGDGIPEIIDYKMCGDPLSAEGKKLAKIMPDGSEKWIFNSNEQEFNKRGIFVFSNEGKELWHLILPWHCQYINTFDWDKDGEKEIIFDTHTPHNGYTVPYDSENQDEVSYNFNWDSLKSTGFLSGRNELDDNSVALMILGMKDGIGQVEYFKYVESSDRDDYHFFCPRIVGEKENTHLEAMEYSMHYNRNNDITSKWWCKPWIQEGSEFKPRPIIEGGYPSMYNFSSQCLFNLPVHSGEPKRVFGLSASLEIMLTDANYNLIRKYQFDPQEIKDQVPGMLNKVETAPDDPTQGNSDDTFPKRNDAVVFDVKDLDGDGRQEILAGFSDFAGDTTQRSVVRIFTDDLRPFHPESGCDRIEVEGPITRAGFEDVNNDGQMDIVILADFPYFLTLTKK